MSAIKSWPRLEKGQESEMGTSVNQPSPNTINWKAAQVTYQDPNAPIERVLREIWRAATSQPEGNLAVLLAEPIVARLRDIVAAGGDASEIGMAATREIALSRQASLAADIAHRAAVQSASAENPAQAYSERLFAEASNYLLSRDLPGFVGNVGRNRTVAQSFEFKRTVLDAATRAVQQVPEPRSSTPDDWRAYTESVVHFLRSRRR